MIVGGGVAGLSAAIHLAWHERKVRVFDRRTGPLFFTLGKLFNVPGMSEMTGVQIQKELLAQAKHRGAEHERADVIRIGGEVGAFEIETHKGDIYRSKTLLLATGVARYHPSVDGDWKVCLKYAAKCNMYYCPDCEAPELIGKSCLVISTGNSRGGVGTAKHLYNFTPKLEILFTSPDPEKRALRDEDAAWLEQHHIPHRTGDITDIVGKKGCVHHITLADGSELAFDTYFVSSPKVPRNDLAKQLGIDTTEQGHIVPASQRGNTSREGVWIAGDVRPMTQQVAVAMGTGNIAAVHIDQFLTARAL